MKDRFQLWIAVAVFLIVAFIVVGIIWPKLACADTVNIGDANCGNNLNVSNRVYRLTENMSCPDIGLNPSVANVTIFLNGFTLTYADDGVGTGAVNGCNTRAEIEHIDCYRNLGGMGIDITGTGWSGLKIIGPGTIRCFVTDTGWADTTKWSMSAIVGGSMNGVKVDNVTLKIYTTNSRPIISQYIDNCTLSNVTCSSTVWHQAIDPTGQANIPFLGGWSSATPNRFTKVRVLGRFPGVGLATGGDANSFMRGCYVEAGENWGSAGIKKNKNGYGLGQSGKTVSCSLIGGTRGMSLASETTIESCYFDIHPVPESGSGAVPGGAGWAIKMQTYGFPAWTGRAKIQFNHFRVSCRDVNDGPASAISIDGSYSNTDFVSADIDSNTFVIWSFKDSTDGIYPYKGHFANALWLDIEAPWRKDSISFFGNYIKSNNRVFSSNSPDNYGIDSFYANCDTLYRWDTLHTAATYSPKFETYHIRAGAVFAGIGWNLDGLTFLNGASADSGSAPNPSDPPIFGSFNCGGSPPAETCSVSPTTLAFGNVEINQTKDSTFTITNTGQGTLSGTVTEGCAGFSIVSGASYSLTADQSQMVTIRFAPTVAQAYNCTVETGNGLCSDVSCSGTGTSPPIVGNKLWWFKSR